MSGGADVRSRLQRFGFSEKAIDAYLAIVDHDRTKPSAVAREADVSTSHVYDLVEHLEERGLVTVEDHKTPTVVTAKPPSTAFERLVEDLQAVGETVAERYEQPEEPDSNFDVINSRPTLVKRLTDRIDNAESEVVIQIGEGMLSEVRPALRRAVDRGVLVLLAVVTDRDTVSHLDLNGVAHAVRVGVDGMSTFLSVDQREGAMAPSSLLRWDHSDDAAISFVQGQVAAVLVGSFLGNYWPLADEVMIQRPRDLPRTYSAVRPAIFDATLHRRVGREVVARMRVRPVQTTQEFTERTGRVVDISQNLVDPRGGSFGFENTFVVEFDDGAHSVGGEDAFIEDYETVRITLMRGDA